MFRPRAFAVIPAREGSRRVEGKNFRPIGDTNLTEITVKFCRETGIFHHVLLTTDSDAGQGLCAKWAIDYHRRSSEAGSDLATASDVLRDIESTLSAAGIRDKDYLFYLQPTSPLRRISTVRDSWERMLKFEDEGVVSVSEIDAKFRKTLFIQGDVLRAYGSRESLTSNQQSLSPLYLANGNFFAFRWGLFLETGTFPIEGLHPVIESDDVTLDIDTESDFERYLHQV